jgi:hypothetical protein
MSDTDPVAIVALLREDMRKGLEEILNEVARQHSPWMNANSAARYADCAPSTIHKAGAQGIIGRYDTFTGPRYKKSEIDAALQGKKLKRRDGETAKRRADPNT